MPPFKSSITGLRQAVTRFATHLMWPQSAAMSSLCSRPSPGCDCRPQPLWQNCLRDQTSREVTKEKMQDGTVTNFEKRSTPQGKREPTRGRGREWHRGICGTAPRLSQQQLRRPRPCLRDCGFFALLGSKGFLLLLLLLFFSKPCYVLHVIFVEPDLKGS